MAGTLIISSFYEEVRLLASVLSCVFTLLYSIVLHVWDRRRDHKKSIGESTHNMEGGLTSTTAKQGHDQNFKSCGCSVRKSAA